MISLTFVVTVMKRIILFISIISLWGCKTSENEGFNPIIQVCDNRWGKDMTYCENSDTMNPNSYPFIIYLALKYGIKVGCFINSNPMWHYSEIYPNLKDAGIIDFDLYAQPTTEQKKSQNSFNEYLDIERSWFKDKFNKYPSCISYYGSDESYSYFATQKMIAGRDNYWETFGKAYTWNGQTYPSKTTLGNPQVGFDRIEQMNHLMSIRWCDEVMYGNYTTEQAIQFLLKDIAATKMNHGFYNAFAHWHYIAGMYPISLEEYEKYFSRIADNKIHFCSFGEAMEYAISRTMIKNITSYCTSDNNVIISVEYSNDFIPIINQDCLNTTISVLVDLSETSLANKNISINIGNFIKVGQNKYIIDVSPPNKSLVSKVTIKESVEGKELNTSIPVLSIDNEYILSDQVVNWIILDANDNYRIKEIYFNKDRIIYNTENCIYGVINKFGRTNIFIP